MTVTDTTYTVQVGRDILSVSVSETGEYHIQSTNNDLKKRLKYFLKYREELPLVPSVPYIKYVADVNEPLGLTAAMLAVSSQALLLKAPVIVLNTITKMTP